MPDGASVCASVPPPAPVPTMMTSKSCSHGSPWLRAVRPPGITLEGMIQPAALPREPGGMSDVGLSEAEFRALYRRVKQASEWGPADRRGALNHLTPARVVAAAAGVRDGRSVSLAAPVESEVTPDNPEPAVHEMTSAGTGRRGLSFAMDRVAMNIHGNADSHLDALCHVVFDGTLYNGIGAGSLTERGSDRAFRRGGQRRDHRPRPAARHPAGAARAVAGAR